MEKIQKGNMGNDHNQRVATLQGSATPSMPKDVALMGLQTFYNYCPTSTMHVIPLVIIHVVYITLKCFPTVTCLLQHITSTNNHFFITCHIFFIVCRFDKLLVFPLFTITKYCYYFPMGANNLLHQRLPFGMPPYSLF